MTARASLFIDRYHRNKNGECKISIKVSSGKVRKYFGVPLTLTPEKFDKIFNSKRKSSDEKEIYDMLNHYLHKANNIIANLPLFTFSLFEEKFYNKTVGESVLNAFDNYIKELKEEGRIGTASSYECARNSLVNFASKKLTFADINPKFLKNYERWMILNGKSSTTVGIYLRSLRSIFNISNIDQAIYPFGKKGYTIPSGRNIKKALSIDQIRKIANYKAKTKDEELARDLFIFSFQCNGMNMKDICLLKKTDINGQIISYTREKTANTKSEKVKINISLKPESLAIIERQGTLHDDNSHSPFLFPIVSSEMTQVEIRKKIQAFTRKINTFLKKIASNLDLPQSISTYYARHSFATVLKRAGANTEFISEALGHSNLRTTTSYLASFEDDFIHEQTKILTGLNNL